MPLFFGNQGFKQRVEIVLQMRPHILFIAQGFIVKRRQKIGKLPFKQVFKQIFFILKMPIQRAARNTCLLRNRACNEARVTPSRQKTSNAASSKCCRVFCASVLVFRILTAPCGLFLKNLINIHQ